MEKDKREIHIFALAAQGIGISGSDRIFIEFARRWSKKNKNYIYVDEEGFEMSQSQKLTGSELIYKKFSLDKWKKFGFLITYFVRIIEGIRLGFVLNLENSRFTIAYSASE